MADFRKLLFAFALIALFVGLSVPASAQLMSCSGTAVNPIMRAEGYTELMGDIIVVCTGGVPTAAGLAVPAVTVTVFTSATVTSKLTRTNVTPAFNESLLIMDEPNTDFNNQIETFNHAVLGCGTGNAVYDVGLGGTPTLGVCKSISTGVPAETYDGNNASVATARPNVFQGRQVSTSSNTAVQFIGVPIDPPGPGRLRIIRMTNIRINGVGVTGGSITGTGFGTGIVQASISFTTPNSVATQAINVTTGTFRNGIDTVRGRTVGPYPQCNPGTDAGSVFIDEGFPSSFKPRNWSQMELNGAYVGTQDWRINPVVFLANPADMNQNVPGVYFSTETGFEFSAAPATADPPINPPPGISTSPGSSNPASVPFIQGAGGSNTGMVLAGSVSQGTRFAIRMTNIPRGSNAVAPQLGLLLNSTGSITGVAYRVSGHDAAGAGGTFVNATAAAIPETGGTQMFVYEVVFSNPVAIETLRLDFVMAPTVDLGATDPVNGSPEIASGGNPIAKAVASFAPFYSSGTSAGLPLALSATATTSGGVTTAMPIPRFIDKFLPDPPINLWSFAKCACDLLFPWVVGDNTFTTSIVVANTSRDPGANFNFTAAPQTGRVRFWYYGTKGIDVSGAPATAVPGSGIAGIVNGATLGTQQTSILVQPGSYVAHIVSPVNGDTKTANGLDKLTGNFAGYVIAQAEFRYCHGVASISSTVPSFGTQTYIGLVMDNTPPTYGITGQFVGEGGFIGIATPIGGTTLPPRTTNLGESFDQ